MKGEERRDHLCEVARGLFVIGGYRGTTTLAVAEAAGVSEALLLKHFGTKEALFRAAVADPLVEMLQEAVEQNWDRVRRGAMQDVEEHVAALTIFGVGWAELIRRHGPMLLALLREANEFPDVAGQVAAMVASVVDQVASSVADLTRGEEYIDFDVRVATYAGLAGMAAAALGSQNIESYIESFVRILMFGLLSPEGRQRVEASAAAGSQTRP